MDSVGLLKIRQGKSRLIFLNSFEDEFFNLCLYEMDHRYASCAMRFAVFTPPFCFVEDAETSLSFMEGEK